MFLKSSWVYLFIVISCIVGYLISNSIVRKRVIEKKINYTSNTASEVYMAWGFSKGDVPPSKLWPSGSYAKDGIIFTRLTCRNNTFYTSLKLNAGTEIRYWMVQKKDRAGNETDIWDAGGQYKKSFRLTFSDDSFFKPGYFIFLAGFIPLLLFYLLNEKNSPLFKETQAFKIKDYIPQFDSLRAIAVLLVIIHHWFSESAIHYIFPNGQLGVNIFFVLSGFLITGILLKAKRQVDEQGLKKTTVFKNFYMRRTLRIFPIYYLLLIILLIINDPDLNEDAVYYFTYTTNYLFYSKQFFSAHLSHLWSLAVEEQFYIFWPWLIILINKRFLPYIIVLFIIIGISSNYIFTNKDWWVEIFTPACFDAFAIGGFLSYLSVYRQDIIQLIQPKFKWIAGGILIIFLMSLFDYSFLPRRTIHSLFAVSIIYYCVFKANNKVLNSVLNNKWLMRIGKISYGVYLYHLFIPELWEDINRKFLGWNIDFFYNKTVPELIKPAWLFIQEFSFLMLICIVSWRLIEKPFNGIKRRFENPGSGKKVEKMIKQSSSATLPYS